MKQHLSKEDLFQNLKMLVFKYNENTNKNLHSLFELAVLLHDVETIKKLSEEYHLIDAIQYLKKKDSRIKKNSLIELLILNADYEVIENEVNSGTYINYKDKVGNTPLIKACILNKVDVVKLLLKNGADTHVRLKNSIRLVESVFNLGYQEVLDLLIEYKADNILDEYAFSFFHDLEKHISSKYVAEQFVYEELDAARNGNDDAMHFVDKCGIKEELYIGAMQNSLPEVDGAAGAQQVLHRLFFSIKTNDNHSLATKIRIMAVEKIMNKYNIGKYENKIMQLTLDNSSTVLIHKGFVTIEDERFEQINTNRFYNPSRKIYLDILNNAVKFSLQTYDSKDVKEDYYAVVNQEEILKFEVKHNPKRLVEILNYFTKDNPIKYTAHSFDWNRYGTYENFMIEVKNTFESIDDDLKFLSPNLYEKITKFLFSDTLNESNTWGINRIGFGWSSKELKQWAHQEELKNGGKKAIYCPIPKGFIKQINGKTISTFEDVCNVFKNEIEIRDDGKLSMLLEELEEEILGFDFEVEYKNLTNVSFYTDVEYLKNGLVKIFEQFKDDTRKDHDSIVIETIPDENGKYIDLLITQIGSNMSKSPDVLKDEIKDGDFQDIRALFLSICDWSILGIYQEEYFKIDFLSSDTEKINISHLTSAPDGFTHQLRFYNA